LKLVHRATSLLLTIFDFVKRFKRTNVTKVRCHASHHVTDELNRVIQWPTISRARTPRGASGWPRIAGALPRAAKPGQSAPYHPCPRPLNPGAPISFFCPSIAIALAHSSSRSTERPLSPFPAPARSASPSHHRSHSTSIPKPRRIRPCSLTTLGKPPCHA